MICFHFIYIFRCTAKDNHTINDIFHAAEISVLFPIQPLFNPTSGTFKPACIRALKRIFRILDINKDGYLSDEELNYLQIKCFGKSLDFNEIQNLKKLIRNSVEDKETIANNNSSSSNTNNTNSNIMIGEDDQLTYYGFEKLMQLILDKEQIHSIWTILRTFNYDDELKLHVRIIYMYIVLIIS
jgi:Ras family protein T1